MKIEKTRRIMEKLYNIHYINNFNKELYMKALIALQTQDIIFNNNFLQESLKKGISLEHTITYGFKVFDLDDFMIKKYILNNIYIIDNNDLNSNPYIKKFNEFYKNDINKIVLDNISLSYSSFEKNQLILLNTPEIQSDYFFKPSIGFFKESFKFPILRENDNVWMSITPSEINTMQQAINKVQGNVLVFGCGLGYFPYMISLKNNVNKITIIEKNEKIIKIFEENILPFFENKDKITIIKEDCFKYLEDFNTESFNYCFCDIWFNNNDGIPLYLKLKQIEKKYKNMQFLYWLENDIIYNIREYIYLNILSVINSMPNMSKLENSERIQEYLDEMDIKRPEDIDYYLNKNNIKRFL